MIFEDGDMRFDIMYTKKGLVESYRPKTMRFFENDRDITENLPPAFLSKMTINDGRKFWVLYLDLRTDIFNNPDNYSFLGESSPKRETPKFQYLAYFGNCENQSEEDAIMQSRIFLNNIYLGDLDFIVEEDKLHFRLSCRDFILQKGKSWLDKDQYYADFKNFVFRSLVNADCSVLINERLFDQRKTFDFFDYVIDLRNRYEYAYCLYDDFIKLEHISRLRGLEVEVVACDVVVTHEIKNTGKSGFDIEYIPVNKNVKNQVLYRMFDVDGRLLYVGISSNAQHRFRQHFSRQPWAKEVCNIKVEFFPCRESVEIAEREAIRREKPKYNVIYAR